MPSDFYSYSPAPGWQDVTATVLASPQYTQLANGLRDKGADVVDVTAYATDTAQVTILFSSAKDDGPEEALSGFDQGARGSMLSSGHEDFYRVDKTASLHVSTQRISAAGAKILAVRSVGIAKGGGLTVVVGNCQAPDEATCDKALATLHVNGDKFRDLSDLPSKDSRLKFALASV